MNLNKNFLTEVIKYLINRGVTLTDVLDTFNEHFNTSDNAIKYEHEKHDEVRKPITDIDLLLCGRKIEKQGFNVKPEPKENPAPLKVSLSPNVRDYPTSVIPRGKGVSKARKMLFEVVEGKTVLEHLKANNIDYKLFDTRIRKNWTMEKACTTPLTRVVQPYTKSKKPVEKADPVIIPENIKVVEETSPKTKMMLVNGRMTEIKVSDTDLVQSSIIEKPVETIETESNTKNTVLATILAANADTNVICLESEKITGTKTVTHAENTTENVTIEPQIKTDTDTRVNDADVNNDVKNDESERIEQLADKMVRDIVTGKNKENKKPKEAKKDYTVADVCFKLNVTTHELKEMISTGEFPQPDCGNKWSVKLLKEKNLI